MLVIILSDYKFDLCTTKANAAKHTLMQFEWNKAFHASNEAKWWCSWKDIFASEINTLSEHPKHVRKGIKIQPVLTLTSFF